MSDRNHRINHEPVFLLNAVPWRESSLRLEVFSRRYGRVALLAHSTRKSMITSLHPAPFLLGAALLLLLLRSRPRSACLLLAPLAALEGRYST